VRSASGISVHCVTRQAVLVDLYVLQNSYFPFQNHSKPKRIRAGNFSAEEKEMMLTFVQEHSVVLESKTADPNI
jgi:hypothetical protein